MMRLPFGCRRQGSGIGISSDHDDAHHNIILNSLLLSSPSHTFEPSQYELPYGINVIENFSIIYYSKADAAAFRLLLS